MNQREGEGGGGGGGGRRMPAGPPILPPHLLQVSEGHFSPPISMPLYKVLEGHWLKRPKHVAGDAQQGHSALVRAHPFAAPESRDAQPHVRAVDKGPSHGNVGYAAVQEEVRHHALLQAGGIS